MTMKFLFIFCRKLLLMNLFIINVYHAPFSNYMSIKMKSFFAFLLLFNIYIYLTISNGAICCVPVILFRFSTKPFGWSWILLKTLIQRNSENDSVILAGNFHLHVLPTCCSPVVLLDTFSPVLLIGNALAMTLPLKLSYDLICKNILWTYFLYAFFFESSYSILLE